MTDAYEGRCGCDEIRYRVTAAPMIVHCCHCRYCQRETGSAFALNAVVETSHVEVLSGTLDRVVTPSASGKGQTIVRCPRCRIAVWSHYPQSGDLLAFLRVGTLVDPDRWPPDIHIYTSTRQPWVVLPEGAKAVAEFYDPKATWSADAMARFLAARAAAG